MAKMIWEGLPFFDERQGEKVRALVIHCCGFDAAGMIDVLRESNLSSHYIIDEQGKIFHLVSEKKRAWHAGVSHWRNMKNLNSSSVGIELCTSSMGQQSYSSKQINGFLRLAKQIISHYRIPAYNVVAHSDIAPTRKPDPGIAFPWQYMAQKGVGLWYDINDAAKVKENDVAKLLQIIGYDTSDLAAASYAFCRHFIPQEIKTYNTIEEVIEKIYPPDFVLPEKYLLILKACAYKYGRFNSHRG